MNTKTVVSILLAATIAGFSGWMFGHKNDQASTAKKANETSATPTPTAAPQQQVRGTYKVPDRFVVYENTALGFRFAYPKEWGDLKMNQSQDLLFSASTPERQSEDNPVNGTMELFANSADKFITQAGYKSASIRPVKQNGTTIWKVAEIGMVREYNVGDTYNP